MDRDQWEYAFDRYDEAECAEFEAVQRRAQMALVPALPQVRPPRRCRACGYARGALGHQVSCLAGAA